MPVGVGVEVVVALKVVRRVGGDCRCGGGGGGRDLVAQGCGVKMWVVVM